MAKKEQLDFMGTTKRRGGRKAKATNRKRRTARTATRARRDEQETTTGTRTKRRYTRRAATSARGAARTVSMALTVPQNPRDAFQMGFALSQFMNQ